MRHTLLAVLAALVATFATACQPLTTREYAARNKSPQTVQTSAASAGPAFTSQRPIQLTPTATTVTPRTPGARSGKNPLCKEGESCWEEIGLYRFTGTIDDFNRLSTAPDWAKAQWTDQYKNNRGTSAVMPDGTLYIFQVYTKDGRHFGLRNVRQALGRDLPGFLFVAEHPVTGEVRKLFLPPEDQGGCDNLSELPPEQKQNTN